MWTILTIFLCLFTDFPVWGILLIAILEYLGDKPIFKRKIK